MQTLIRFFREARTELSRVNWPSRKELAQYTAAVIVISLAMALFLGSLDFLFSHSVENFILR